MNEFKSDYIPTRETMALLPYTPLGDTSLVIEHNEQFIVRKSPIELIKKACLENHSTYDGRRDAVVYQTGYKRKVPIPINPGSDLYSFPTHSTTDPHCSWLFYHSISNIKPASGLTNPQLRTIITFHNGKQIPIDISYYTLKKQMGRTLTCIFVFSSEGREMLISR
ncbi:competence protein ComK [Oceanobacillus rekensis]|uniref:competence protein ComK n=1 Tax=Oceanobacillus rekensis TaxID=937927 RepID=UPI000B434EA3|nr:competence protein ComK [Oceanobacillus rekensis]